MFDVERVEKVARAMEEAEFGYSLRLVSLIEGKETWALRYNDGETLEFDSSASAHEHIAAKRRRTQAEAALAAAEAGEQPVATFTTGHCKEKQKPGGCQLHNLHCAYPDCDQKPVASPPSEASRDEKVRYRHKKRGTTYAVIGIARVQTDRPLDDMEPVTVYRCEQTGELWARRSEEFYDGRFEPIDDLPTATAIRARGET